jgi:hypothetical protein
MRFNGIILYSMTLLQALLRALSCLPPFSGASAGFPARVNALPVFFQALLHVRLAVHCIGADSHCKTLAFQTAMATNFDVTPQDESTPTKDAN